jgi:hypothetical protein
MRSSALVTAAALGALTIGVFAQAPNTPPAKKYQARPPATQPFGKEAFAASTDTVLRWTGNAGFLIKAAGPRS